MLPPVKIGVLGATGPAGRGLAARLSDVGYDVLAGSRERVKAEKAPGRGYDAENMDYVDMLQAGIIDPAKVERVALQNAASVASLLLTTECIITDIPEEKAAAAPPMPHGDF